MNSNININDIIKIEDNNWTTDRYNTLNGNECDDQYVEWFMANSREVINRKLFTSAQMDDNRMFINEMKENVGNRCNIKFIKVRLF